MTRFARFARFVALAGAVAAWPMPVLAHDGPPFPIIVDQRLGPYVVTVWTDPDIGTGTFYVVLETADGVEFTQPSSVRIGVAPISGRLAEILYDADAERVRSGARFLAEVAFDRGEQWHVRVIIESAAGGGELTSQVEATPAGTIGPIGLVVYSLPFVLIALLWWRAAVARRQLQASTSDLPHASARRVMLSLIVTLALTACQREPMLDTVAGESPQAPEWARTAVVYEVNVRQYTPEGTFAALQKHIPRLDSLGIDILWLMPVQPIGLTNRKGGLGSYYSVRNYTAINPEFGTAADARAFIDAAHAVGLKVILDWVPNHTAFDHVWIAAHPDWYVHRPDGSISYALDSEGRETDWTDVAELNYDNADMRRAMIADMRWWLDSLNIDGFRQDVTWGVPMDFWHEARRELTAVRPDIFLLAESEGPQYHSVFHATYGWELHHLLNEIARGTKEVRELDAYFARQDSAYPRNAYRMYFTSNHDENSWQGTEFERMGQNHLPAFVLAATVRNSLPLLYTGQEASLRKRLRFFEKDTVDWRGPTLASFYRAMFDLKERNPALWNGADGGDQTRLTTTGADRVYAFTRTRGDNTVLVAVNFGDAAARVSYDGLATHGSYTNWFTQGLINLGVSGTMEIPPHGYLVLVRQA